MSSDRNPFYLRAGKRIFDLALTVPAVMIFIPLLAALAVAVRVFLGSPVLFRQNRPGFGGASFTLYKFRTMTDALDEEGQPLPDAKRLTRLGRFLRSTSLDELPELWNVLKGDMSLVGPRPLLMQYLGHYTAEQARRHEVKPGITGWAQVKGRNSLKFSERLKKDVWYVDHLSLWLDMKIILLTFISVLRREGVRADFESCLAEVDDCGFNASSIKPRNGKPDAEEVS